MLTTSHHKQLPLENKEKDTTLSTLLRRLLLKLNKKYENRGKKSLQENDEIETNF